ncbi:MULTISPECIES: LytTR family DNA-binding domain-containing protein [unclassified Paenibacillus]|uniref:LytTR family DNA-binding domain-containing protein n=1 Tax=unclassified Paenibacillus TaxID=185978 RepID=UPI0030FB3E48
MEIRFEADPGMDRGSAKVVTHPAEQVQWKNLETAIQAAEKRITVINASNNRQVSLETSKVAVIEAEDRMCSVRLITGEMYLLNTRLKFAMEALDTPGFIKINNQTIINTRYIKEFSATANARVEVLLTDNNSYTVSRYYINDFRRNYHG